MGQKAPVQLNGITAVCCNHLGCVLAPLQRSFPVKAGFDVTQTGGELRLWSKFWETGSNKYSGLFTDAFTHCFNNAWTSVNLLPWSWFQSLDIFSYFICRLAFSNSGPQRLLGAAWMILGCWRTVVSICRNQSWVRKRNYPGPDAGVNNCV